MPTYDPGDPPTGYIRSCTYWVASFEDQIKSGRHSDAERQWILNRVNDELRSMDQCPTEV